MRKGFTLIELMIVIAIIAIIAAIAIPNLLESKISAAESAASASLRSGLHAAQVAFQKAGHNDIDGDNEGEYGHYGILAGTVGTWGVYSDGGNIGVLGPDQLSFLGTEFDSPDVLALASSTTEDINGYISSTYLNADSTATDNANDAEQFFVACSVPSLFGDTGRRAFVITQNGKVYTGQASDLYEADTDIPLIVSPAPAQWISCFDAVASAVTRTNRNAGWEPQ